MRSLEERQAQRKEQKEQSAKERAGTIGGDKWEQNEVNQGKHLDNTAGIGGGLGPNDTAVDPKVLASDSVENIKAKLTSLSDEQLNAVEKAEGEGKKRNAVRDAIIAERKRRESAGNGWGANR